MFKLIILFIIFLCLKKGLCNLGIFVEEYLINICLFFLVLIMVMMMFFDVMKGNFWLIRFFIICRE